jgi:hypothetical protein
MPAMWSWPSYTPTFNPDECPVVEGGVPWKWNTLPALQSPTHMRMQIVLRCNVQSELYPLPDGGLSFVSSCHAGLPRRAPRPSTGAAATACRACRSCRPRPGRPRTVRRTRGRGRKAASRATWQRCERGKCMWHVGIGALRLEGVLQWISLWWIRVLSHAPAPALPFRLPAAETLPRAATLDQASLTAAHPTPFHPVTP